jgi:transposase
MTATEPLTEREQQALEQASANLFSLVMTARANGIDPFEYLSELFEQLPTATTVEELEGCCHGA